MTKTLYDPSFEHDNCGIGAVVNIDGSATHKIVDNALSIVEKLEHRAGKDATGETGDGVGILVQISHDFFKEAARKEGIELKLGTFPKVAQLQLGHGEIEQREVDTRDETKECGRVLQGGGVFEDTLVVDHKTSRSGRGHGIIDAVEPIHAKQHVAGTTTGRDKHVDDPKPLGAHRQARVQLVLHGARSLCRKHPGASTHHRRQDGDREEHDTQSTQPLGERAPEKDAVRQRLHVIDDGRASGSEARHAFEEGVGETGYVASEKERHGSK